MTRVLQAQVPLLALDGGTGQYFQETFNLLVECCDANTAAIAATSSTVGVLTLRVAANEAAIISLQAQITALALRVTANEVEIADHELRIVALEP